jgi:hypothetical protein
MKQAANRAALLDTGFFLCLLLDPEDGGDMLLQNVDFEWTTWHYIP